jgi:hypothetical protein
MRTLVLLAVLLPTVALAQSPPADVTYCNRLASLYVYYIGRSEAGPFDDLRRGSIDNQVAASQCNQGRTAEAIPVLERVLRNNGFALPPRG